jgi:hypothetical protein
VLYVPISILEHKIKCVCVCDFCVFACDIDLTELIFVEVYKDLPKAICGITFMHFTYKFMYSLRELYSHPIPAFIISVRYSVLVFY